MDKFTEVYKKLITEDATTFQIQKIAESVWGKNWDFEVKLTKTGFELIMSGKAYGSIYNGSVTYENGKQVDLFTDCYYENADDDESQSMQQMRMTQYLTKEFEEAGNKYVAAGYKNFTIRMQMD